MSIYEQPVVRLDPPEIRSVLGRSRTIADEPPIITHDLSSRGSQATVSEAGVDRFEWSLDRPWADSKLVVTTVVLTED